MREIKIFHFFKILFIFHLNLSSLKAIDIEILVPQRGGINLLGLNPFEEFLNFNSEIERIADGILDSTSNDGNETIEIFDNINDIENTNDSNRVHREIKRTHGNGFETIEITEVHIGRAPNPGEILEMPIGGFMISKQKNLKGKSKNVSSDIALPFHIITQFDDFLESLFGDFAIMIAEDDDPINAKTIHEKSSGEGDIDLNIDIDQSHSETDEEEYHDHENSHQDHIKVTEVRDVTEEEKSRNKIKNVPEKEKEDNLEIEKKSDDAITIEDQNETNTQQDIERDEDQSIAIKFDAESDNKSSDNIMTAKERKNQIKEQRKKNLFAKICKYVFYSLVLLSFYILIKKLLQIFGLIDIDNIKKPYDIPEANKDDKKNIELKSSNTKSE